MVLCAAYNCNVRSGQGVAMYFFPTDKIFRRKWIEKLKTASSYSPSQHSKLCERHFDSDQFKMNPSIARAVGYSKLELKDDAVPTIFNYTPKERAGIRKREVPEEKTTPARSRKSMVPLKRRILQEMQQSGKRSTPCSTSSSSNATGSSISTETEDVVQQDSSSIGNSLMFSSFSQTTYGLVSRRHVKLQTDIQDLRSTFNTKQTRTISTQTDIPQEDLDQSVSSMTWSDNGSDPDWSGEAQESFYNDKFTESTNLATERKFIVFESAIDTLFDKCRVCGVKPIVTKHTKGTCLTVDTICACGDAYSWDSQPQCGSMPMGNLILAGAVLFSGSSPVKFLRVLQHASIQAFCLRTYNNIQSAYLVPAVTKTWKHNQNILLQEIKSKGDPITIGGDARCCSPGHTAKYGSYSLMDLHSNKILDLQLIQSNEVKNSYAMEMEGLQRSLVFLEAQNVEISNLVTDRHSQVKKFMRDQKPEIKHWFDCWHVAKGIFKKLEAQGKKKTTAALNDWARSISNHLYWCAASSDGDGDLVKEKWLSILNHVTDVHVGHGEHYTECLHEQLEERMWIKRGSPTFKALEKVVKGRLLMSDISNLSPAEQTSGLEAFHKVVCHFAPKLVHYFHPQMEARLYLAVLHFNENSARAQAMTKDGRLMFSISYPKGRKGEGIAKEVKEQQTFVYVNSLMKEVLELREQHQTYSRARENLQARNRPGPLSHSTPHKLKHEIVEGHIGRFNR